MLERLRQRQPGRSIGRILWWHLLHLICYVWVGPCYRYRAWGIGRIPRSGPVLFVSNHQSFLDPILVGLGAHHRQFYAMARSTLFDHPVFAWLIGTLNAIPVERGQSDTASMRKCIDVLGQGHALLLFPEGTRTPDGTTQAFQRGLMLLIKRAQPTIVPVAIDGAFDAWPKGRKCPRATGRIFVEYGRPIPAADLLQLPSDAALDELRQRIESTRQVLSQRRQTGR
jgi:1-acyl-sn-glycerol-3-phosphate acyltransferase